MSEDHSQMTLEDFFYPLGESKVCTNKNLALRSKLFRILFHANGDPMAEMLNGNLLAFWIVPGIGNKGMTFIEDRLEELGLAPWQIKSTNK